MSSGERRLAGVIEPRTSLRPQAPRRATWVRLVGAAGMLALTAALWWLLTDASFRVEAGSVTVLGVRYADEARVQELLGDLARGPNVFRIRPRDMAAGLMTLPEVRSARVSVRLSGEVHVDVKEREPIFVWSNGGDAWLVDREGVLFARPGPEDLPAPAVPGSTGDDPATQDPEPGASVTPDATPPALDAPSGTGGDAAARSVLPMVEDARLARQAPDAGDRLGEVDLAVLRQLLALTPETIASASRSLRLRVDERDGYVLESMDLGWQALFGRYSPTLHPPDSIPRQVQCLAALLGDREDRVSRVWLVPSGSGCGTYLRMETTG